MRRPVTILTSALLLLAPAECGRSYSNTDRPADYNESNEPWVPTARPETPPAPPDVAPRPRKPERKSRDQAAPSTPKMLVLRPTVASRPEQTHSAICVTRNTYYEHVVFKGRVKTVRQLRVGTPPNPWEAAWLVWHYHDSHHFYYLAVKPNGWELGKADPAYPGQQRFLHSGETEYPIGEWHDFEIEQHGNLITISLNGTELAKFRDRERPYRSGKVGIYAEDSEIQLTDVTAPLLDDFKEYPLQTSRSDGWRSRNWTAPFLGFGEVSIAANTP
jgi:hypothetical protein